MTDDLKQLLDRAVDWYEPPEHLLDGAWDRLDRRRIRRRMSAGVLGLVVAVIGGIVAWQAFQPVRESPAVDGGWYRVGHVDELRARRIACIPELETFVIALPGEGPFALSASSPHQGERLLFCRTSGWFFSPAHGEMFDVQGNYELGPAPSGMNPRPVRVVDGVVEVDGSTDLEPAPRGDGPADPEWSGPPCASDSGAFVEDEPGFASIPGDLPQADRFPVEIVEGVEPGGTLEDYPFLGLEVGFPASEITVRLLGGDGSILDERRVRCAEGDCPGYAYADLAYTIDAPQQGTILLGTLDVESGTFVWFRHIPVAIEPPSGVEPGSYIGTWYDVDGNPTYSREGRGWYLELHVIEGPEHCGWQSAALLRLAWPLGSASTGGEMATRLYVRDPDGVLPTAGSAPLDLAATLPEDAAYVGYHRGPWELWVSPSEVDDAVYLVAGEGAVIERWPRSPEVGCD